MSKETGGPAFPREDYQANGHERGFENLGQEGMSLRDYFAAKAMAALISGAMADGSKFGSGDPVRVSLTAFFVADAMLKVRGAE